jgi:hypothetical protein
MSHDAQTKMILEKVAAIAVAGLTAFLRKAQQLSGVQKIFN